MFSSKTANPIKWPKGIDFFQQRIIENELEDITTVDVCILCDKRNVSGNYTSHKLGTTHQNNVNQYIRTRLIEMQSDSCVKVTEEKDKEEISDKLKNLITTTYCFVCLAMLPDASQYDSHYKSKRHKETVEMWIAKETMLKRGGCANLKAQMNSETSNARDDKNNNSKNSPGCMACGLKIDTNSQVYCESCTETFCSVCNLKTHSIQQLAEHKKGQKHKKKLEERQADDNLTIPRIIVTPRAKKGANSSSSSLVQKTITLPEGQNTCATLDNHMFDPKGQTPQQSSEILSTVKQLIKQLDYLDLKQVAVALECRMNELDSKTKGPKLRLEYN